MASCEHGNDTEGSIKCWGHSLSRGLRNLGSILAKDRCFLMSTASGLTEEMSSIQRYRGQNLKLTTHLRLVLKFRMRGALQPLPHSPS
jgi:hypothetical protein